MLQKIKNSLLLILGLLAAMQSVYAKSNTKLIIENHFKDKILYFRVVTDPENLIDLDSDSSACNELSQSSCANNSEFSWCTWNNTDSECEVDYELLTVDDCYMYGLILGDGYMNQNSTSCYISFNTVTKNNSLFLSTIPKNYIYNF